MAGTERPLVDELVDDRQISDELETEMDERAATIRPKSEVTTKHDRMIQALLPRHFKMIELALQGHAVNKIAEILGMNKCAVSSVLRSPMIQNELARRRAELQLQTIEKENLATTGAMNILNEQADRAARTLGSLLDSCDERIKLSSAKEILDRVLNKNGDEGQPRIMIQADQLQMLNVSIKESLGKRSANLFQVQQPSQPTDQAYLSFSEGVSDATERCAGSPESDTDFGPGTVFADAEPGRAGAATQDSQG